MKLVSMKFLFGILMVSAALSCPALADDCPPNTITPDEEQIRTSIQNATNHGFLWRISKDGHASYLYGTIHVARLEWMFPGPAVAQALRSSKTIALELDVLDPDILQRLVKGMTEQQGVVLPEPLAQRMRQHIQQECISEDNIKKMIPEMQIAMLSMASGRRDGIDPAYAIDAVLAGFGHRAKLNVVSLETPELQLKTLQMETSQETVEIVQRSLDEMENGKARAALKETAEVWSESDYDKLDHYRDWCDCLGSEVERKLMARMLDDRNPAMADHIDALHAEGVQVFAAVGSLHMAGENGLPALMAKRAYQVERIDLKP